MKLANNFRNTTIRIALTAVLILFFSLQNFAQLKGTYTIDKTGGTFPTKNCKSFNEAVDSLESQGVSGAVIFNVVDDTYNEQVVITQISGASSDNTITFQSESLDSTAVILTYSSSDYSYNWTLRLNGADYVTIRKMTLAATGATYGRIININGTARYDTIEN